MKIGEFAKACNTNISVLRYYDRMGLLKPVYIDRFTEYRYYDESQAAMVKRIKQMKKAGFSLTEIKSVITSNGGEPLLQLIEQKQKKLEAMLNDLTALKQSISGGFIMEHKFKPFVEEINIPFENDPQVIGKWEVLGEQHDGEEYPASAIGNKKREMYFLPNGEQYWCYSWTKGYLLFNDGVNSFSNEYRIEQRGDDLYMVVQFKSIEYPKTGGTTAIALRKTDSRHYTKYEIAKKDDINKPFIDDDRVKGKWKALEFLTSLNDFAPTKCRTEAEECENLYFSEIKFFENGHCTSVYGGETVSGDNMQVWTKGYVLRKWNSTACAYKLRTVNGTDYLIIEWKSGDYRWGDMDTDYYVFVRDNVK